MYLSVDLANLYCCSAKAKSIEDVGLPSDLDPWAREIYCYFIANWLHAQFLGIMPRVA